MWMMPALPQTRQHDFKMVSVDYSSASLLKYDCVLLATDHDVLDYELLRGLPCVIDSRGVLDNDKDGVIRA